MEESCYGDFKVAVDLTPLEVQWVVRSLISTIDDLYEQVLFGKADAKDTSIKMQEQIDALWKENAKLKKACEVVEK